MILLQSEYRLRNDDYSDLEEKLSKKAGEKVVIIPAGLKVVNRNNKHSYRLINQYEFNLLHITSNEEFLKEQWDKVSNGYEMVFVNEEGDHFYSIDYFNKYKIKEDNDKTRNNIING